MRSMKAAEALLRNMKQLSLALRYETLGFRLV